MVIDALRDRGLWPEQRTRNRSPSYSDQKAELRVQTRTTIATVSPRRRQIWRESLDPRTAQVDAYLDHRGLPPLSDDQAGTVFRFSRTVRSAQSMCPAWSPASRRSRTTDGGEPTAIARIRLDRFEGNDRRLSLGPAPARR